VIRTRGLFFVTSSRDFDYSQGYHRPWLPDCPGWKTEQREERRGARAAALGRIGWEATDRIVGSTYRRVACKSLGQT
jgi:hypothetical protein